MEIFSGVGVGASVGARFRLLFLAFTVWDKNCTQTGADYLQYNTKLFRIWVAALLFSLTTGISLNITDSFLCLMWATTLVSRPVNRF